MSSRLRWYSLAFIFLLATAVIAVLRTTRTPEIDSQSPPRTTSLNTAESPGISPSPLPSPSILASPFTASPLPSPSDTTSSLPVPTPSASPEASAVPIPTPAFVPSPSPVPSLSPVPSPSPVPSLVAEPEPEPASAPMPVPALDPESYESPFEQESPDSVESSPSPVKRRLPAVEEPMVISPRTGEMPPPETPLSLPLPSIAASPSITSITPTSPSPAPAPAPAPISIAEAPVHQAPIAPAPSPEIPAQQEPISPDIASSSQVLQADAAVEETPDDASPTRTPDLVPGSHPSPAPSVAFAPSPSPDPPASSTPQSGSSPVPRPAPAPSPIAEVPSPATQSRSMPVTDEELEVMVEQAYNNLKTGKITWNPPEAMNASDAEVVTARISKKLEQDLTENLGDNPVTAEIKVSTFMQASLSGEEFEIEAQTPDRQILSSQGVAEWRWKVTPQKEGEQILTLSVYAGIKLSNDAEEKVLPIETYRQPVRVEVSPSTLLGNSWKWATDNAEGLAALSAIATGIGTFAVTRWQQIGKWVQGRMNRERS